jgi:NDP-sugar pyrophosphorylase family protein
MRISRFVEKPTKSEAPSNLANTGLYLVTPEIRAIFREKGLRELMQKNRRLDFGYDFIPYLIRTGRPVYGYTLEGSWYDIGTPKRYLEAMTEILYGKLSSLTDFGGRISKDRSIWVQGESKESTLRREEIIQKIEKGRIQLEEPVLIGRHCQVSDGVRIVDSCIDNYSKIGKNVVIENSAVMDRVIIGENAQIRNSIIGRHSTIESTKNEPTQITSTSVIADDVTIAAGSTFMEAKVYPHLHISRGNYREIVFSS